MSNFRKLNHNKMGHTFLSNPIMGPPSGHACQPHINSMTGPEEFELVSRALHLTNDHLLRFGDSKKSCHLKKIGI